MYTCDLGRMADKITTMSKYGDAGHGGITRYSLSPEALQARGEFVKRMKVSLVLWEQWKCWKALQIRRFLINIILRL